MDLKTRLFPYLGALLASLYLATERQAEAEPADAPPAEAEPADAPPAEAAPADVSHATTAKSADAPHAAAESASVPPYLQGQGYVLRLEESDIPLTGTQIDLPESERHQDVELLDGNGRLLAEEYAYLDSAVFAGLHPRTWRVSIWGGSSAINGSPFRSLLQDASLAEQSIDVDWQPSVFGLRLGLTNQGSDEKHFHVESHYEDVIGRLAATYEVAGFLGRMHALFDLGVLAAVNRIRIDDAVVSESATSKNGGAVGGVDLLYPVYGGLWIGLKGEYSYQRVSFPAFNFHHDFVERSASFGGSYAF